MSARGQRARAGLVLTLVLAAGCLLGEDTGALAGPGELAALDAQIQVVQERLAALRQTQHDQDMATAQWAVDAMQDGIRRYVERPVPAPPSPAGFGPWYLALLQTRRGCDPLGPPSPLVAAWIRQCASSDAADAAVEQVVCILHRLEHLRHRLARQLGLLDGPGGAAR